MMNVGAMSPHEAGATRSHQSRPPIGAVGTAGVRAAPGPEVEAEDALEDGVERHRGATHVWAVFEEKLRHDQEREGLADGGRGEGHPADRPVVEEAAGDAARQQAKQEGNEERPGGLECRDHQARVFRDGRVKMEVHQATIRCAVLRGQADHSGHKCECRTELRSAN